MANELEMIAPISNAKKAEIERMGAAGLPDSPSEEGMTTEEIKRAFYEPENALIVEINRIVDETNEVIGTVGEDLDGHASDRDNPHEVTEEQIAHGTGTVKDALDALEADGSVTTAKLAAGAVTDAKVAAGIAQSKVSGLTEDYVADADMNGSNLSLKNKEGGEIASVPLAGAFRKVAESDRARNGAEGAYTFALTAGKKYLVAMFGDYYDNYGRENHYVNATCLAIAGVNFYYQVTLKSSTSSTTETLCSVSGNTLTVNDWKYKDGSDVVTGARHVVVFEVV